MTKPFLIIGGYGTVGSHLVSLLKQFLPDLPLAIAGRNKAKAQELASHYDNTVGLEVDTRRADLGIDSSPGFSGVVVLTNDLSTNPVQYAIKHNIPYTSIATQLNHIAPKLTLSLMHPECKILIQDTSFASSLISIGMYCAKYFRQIEQIRVASLMDENDLGGPASQSDAGDFSQKEAGLLLEDGQWIIPRNGKEIREYTLEDGFSFAATSFPGFDAPELAYATSANSVRVDFAFGQSYGSRFAEKPSVDIIYEIEGTLSNGENQTLKFQLSHPEGQAFLTAAGVAVGIESLLKQESSTGLCLSSQKIDPDLMKMRLIESGALFKQINIKSSS